MYLEMTHEMPTEKYVVEDYACEFIMLSKTYA